MLAFQSNHINLKIYLRAPQGVFYIRPLFCQNSAFPRIEWLALLNQLYGDVDVE